MSRPRRFSRPLCDAQVPGVGQVLRETKISASQGGFVGPIDNGDRFGDALASMGDVNGDGVDDLMVGAPSDDTGGADRGALWMLLMNADGTVGGESKLASPTLGVSPLQNGDLFGIGMDAVGDYDGDGLIDLVVGGSHVDDGGQNVGAVFVLFMGPQAIPLDIQKISATSGSFGGQLDVGDRFGNSVATLDDLDGDGLAEIAVSAHLDDDGGTNRGAVWILFLNQSGTVRTTRKISALQGGASSARSKTNPSSAGRSNASPTSTATASPSWLWERPRTPTALPPDWVAARSTSCS